MYSYFISSSPSRQCARVQAAAAGSPWRPRRPVRQAHSPRTTGNKAAAARGLHNKLTPASAPLGPPRHTWWRTEPFSSPSSVRLKSSVGVTNYRSEYWNHCHYRWSLHSLLNKRPRRGGEGGRGHLGPRVSTFYLWVRNDNTQLAAPITPRIIGKVVTLRKKSKKEWG